MSVDPNYEYEAPMFVDFSEPLPNDYGIVDQWFDGKRSLGRCASPSGSKEKVEVGNVVADENDSGKANDSSTLSVFAPAPVTAAVEKEKKQMETAAKMVLADKVSETVAAGKTVASTMAMDEEEEKEDHTAQIMEQEDDIPKTFAAVAKALVTNNKPMIIASTTNNANAATLIDSRLSQKTPSSLATVPITSSATVVAPPAPAVANADPVSAITAPAPAPAPAPALTAKRPANLVTSWANTSTKTTTAAATATSVNVVTTATTTSKTATAAAITGKKSAKGAALAATTTKKQQQDAARGRPSRKKTAPPVKRKAASSSKPTLTQPKTPEVMRRSRSRSHAKTSEELELEKIAKLRSQAKKKRKLSASSFERLKQSTDYVPARSSKPLTQAKAPKFATDSRRTASSSRMASTHESGTATKTSAASAAAASRCNTMPGRTHGMILRDFRARPASSTSTATTAAPQVTKPRPFKLSGMKRLQQQARKPFIALAQQVQRFSSKTPPRYHNTEKGVKKSRGGGIMTRMRSMRTSKPKLTVPQSPALTKTVSRKHVASTAEREEEMMTAIASKPFKARPVNPAIMNSVGDYGVPRVAKKEPTVPSAAPRCANVTTSHKEGDLTTATAAAAATIADAVAPPAVVPFKAREVPRHVLDGTIVGVPERTVPALTVPQSPAITKMAPRPAPAPAPPLAPAPGTKWTGETTIPEPFERMNHYETRAAKVTRREQQAAAELQAMRASHTLTANPIPSTLREPARLATFEAKPATKPQPFRLRSHSLGVKLRQQHEARVRSEQEAARQARNFTATQPKVLVKKPFRTAPSDAQLCQINEFALNSDARGRKRAVYEAGRKERELAAAQEMDAQRAENEARAAEEIRKLREAAIHRAQPVRNFKSVVIRQSEKMLTQPISPMVGKRGRNGMRV